MRKALFPALLGVFMITGCGGGGGSSDVSVPIFILPAESARETVIVSVGLNHITLSNGDFLVRFAGPNDVTFSGDENRIMFAANENGGQIRISGNNNTVIFRPNMTATSLSVTGANNTIYIAEGSGLTISGPQGAGTTVRTYSY